MTNSLTMFPAPPIAHLIGHRGLPSMAPENSLEGFKLAAEAGLNWVEFDVQVTRDNQLIIMHDDTITRTTNGTGIVYELNLEQLQQYKLKNSTFSIPTLTETMALLDHYKVQANIELKLPENISEKELSPIREKLFTAFDHYLKSAWPHNKPWPLVSSFDHPILNQIRKHYPDIPLGFLIDKPNSDHLALAKQQAPASVNAQYIYLTPHFLKLAKQQNIPIYAYTVNQLEKAQELLDWGVYGLFTDIGNTLKVALNKNNETKK